jgi:23S rRNA (uracil1939-C5)-methyltransferase
MTCPAEAPAPFAHDEADTGRGRATVTIDRLGHLGDGIAETADGPLFVPFALPGERVVVARTGGRAELLAVETPSPDRITPACRHFGDCGGCALQHLAPLPYAAFKRTRVVEALAAERLEVPVEAIVTVPAGSRRRATLAARRTAGGITLGYHARGSHRLVAIEECPVLLPALAAALPRLKRLAARLCHPKDATRLVATLTDGGLDVALFGAKRIDEAERTRLPAFAGELGLARLAVDGEVVATLRAPALDVGGVAVVPPPGGFVQAVAEAEAALAGIVTGAVGKARRVLDLYAGIGTFALRLARTATVHAVEGEASAIAALEAARRIAQGLKPVTTERRDLVRRPFMPKDFGRFDAVVLDPPHAGAKPQVELLAKAAVPRVVYVSCNPATLARDLAVLVAGGYAVDRVVPVDQFVWSAEVEAVAVLSRRR